MNENILTTTPISSLIERNFFIPSYQRGYRWTEQQVKDLLNDITNFSPLPVEKKEEKTWYCLQPIVVKECDSDIKKENYLDQSKTWYEVIDGQQRLTTIYLIGHYINEMWRGEDKDSEIQLNYQTREESTSFLTNLKRNAIKDVDVNTINIDYFHISEAYKTINDWVINKENSRFTKDNFIDKFFNHTKVIWYESIEKDTISIFTRLNSGKIPLTNAELIKALFLNSSNFKGHEEVQLKQLEIASEWDRIEYTLQNDSFWYFINESKNELDTRIEFIFNLMANKPEENDNDYFTFDHFNNKFATFTRDEITNNWAEITTYFQTLEEWFADRELFHKIGYLISFGDTIKSLSIDCTKKEFKKKLDNKIKDKVSVQLSKLNYKNASEVRRVLLLHNIQTLLNNKFEDSRFPFDRYKKQNWDIEHINSVAEEMPKSEKHQQDWLTETMEFLDDNKLLKEKSKVYNKDEFEQLFKDIIAYFDKQDYEDETNYISNLVLLDSKTNRGYKNAVYPVKRKTIISKDKSGTFIPICTKNVFMKFYNRKVSQMTFWGEEDRNGYYDDIKTVISNYLPIQIEDINHDKQ